MHDAPSSEWWIKTMEYVRKAPGRVYADQLYSIIESFTGKDITGKVKTSGKNIAEYLNETGPDHEKHVYLKMDPMTGGIYTIPSQRHHLDRLIKDLDGSYVYNRFLYMDSIPPDVPGNTITFDAMKSQYPELFDSVFRFDLQTGQLDIDLSVMSQNGFDSFNNFSLNAVLNHFSAITSGRIGIYVGSVNGENMIFTGRTSLSVDSIFDIRPVVKGNLYFNGATFLGAFVFENLDLVYGAGFGDVKLDFRNCRFFDSVIIRDIRVTGNSPEMEISFEDARIQKNFEVINANLGNMNLNCFQIVIGDFVYYSDSTSQPVERHNVKILNLEISEEGNIEFTDAEIDHTDLYFVNINPMPEARLDFAPCLNINADNETRLSCPDNYLLIRNCEINETLYISNVKYLSLYESNNNGRIVDGKDWGDCSTDKNYRLSSRGLGGTNLKNPLLLAVYNNTRTVETENGEFWLNHSKANDFITLKENFCSVGKYDEEDDAFMLYMEFKPYLDGFRMHRRNSNAPLKKNRLKELVYKSLYATGKYGISPYRVLFSLSILILLTSISLFIDSLIGGIDMISLNNAMGWTNLNLGNSASLPYVFLACLIYSIGNIIPFTSQFEAIELGAIIISIIENSFGSFLIGYFSVAVIRKTLR